MSEDMGRNDKFSKSRQFAKELVADSIITDAAAQFIALMIEEIHKTKIKPLQDELACRADLPPTPAQIMSDPNAVHINMLHGRIANPSVEQIVHIYAGKVQAVSVEPVTAQIMADPRVIALVEAGEVMAKALRGDYIVPCSAKAWDAALAQLKEPKP